MDARATMGDLRASVGVSPHKRMKSLRVPMMPAERRGILRSRVDELAALIVAWQKSQTT